MKVDYHTWRVKKTFYREVIQSGKSSSLFSFGMHYIMSVFAYKLFKNLNVFFIDDVLGFQQMDTDEHYSLAAFSNQPIKF